jgi:coenzyme F420 hydrogenase subunit beta
MNPRLRSIEDVAQKHLCQGCGTCAFVQPDVISMVDVPEQGRRPLVLHVKGRPADTSEALACCSGAGYGHEVASAGTGIAELRDGWGPVLEVWEGFATDPEVRLAGSSGGVATALSLFGIEQQGMAGVLHITSRDDVPYLNKTVLSTTREELMSATGSRYAPASPCERLDLVEAAAAPCVLIGKPCDIAGADLARKRRPALDEKLGLTIAIFCAGTPTTQGTLEMVAAAGVQDPGEVTGVRYRGNGWPGLAEVRTGEAVKTFTYHESWGEILQKHRQWRCHVCADHTGEMADVAVGDPWYRPTGDDPGRSLVLVRTERGRRAVQAAVQAGVLTLERVPASTLPASQMNLLRTRGSVWGRSFVLRTARLPAPRFRGMPMFRYFLQELTIKQKAQATVGTLRRIRAKRLREPAVVVPGGSAKDDAGPPPGDGRERA